MTTYLQEKSNSNGSKFLIRNHRDRKEVAQHFSTAERNELSTSILYPEMITFRNAGEIRPLSDKKKNTKLICHQDTYHKREARESSLNRMLMISKKT